MPKKYYLQETGIPGPAYTSEDLEQRYRTAQVDGDTLCWPDDFFSIGWKPLRTFFPHFHSPSLAQEQQNENQEHRERDTDQNREVAFDCVDCGTALRLRHLQDHTAYRCPSCKTEYKVMQANHERQVFLVVPASRVHKHSASTPPNPKKPISPKTRVALETFGLGEEATFEQVRRAYREHVKLYHPDTVAHLGPELRSLAEMKTKQFNSAYQTLEQFYAN
jgi:DnaJ-domain-containing protein 1